MPPPSEVIDAVVKRAERAESDRDHADESLRSMVDERDRLEAELAGMQSAYDDLAAERDALRAALRGLVRADADIRPKHREAIQVLADIACAEERAKTDG